MRCCIMCGQSLPLKSALAAVRAKRAHPGLKCRDTALEDRIEDVVANLIKSFKA